MLQAYLDLSAELSVAESLVLCGETEGVAQYSQSHISKLNFRRTAQGRALWVRCGWWQTGSQWDSWRFLPSRPGCIMVVVQMRFALVGIHLLWPV